MIRKASCNELLYTDLQDFTNTYAIQFVLKVKRIDNLPVIEDAINTVLSVNPGVNVYLKNGEYFKCEEKVRIEEYEVPGDDVFNDEIFQKSIDYTDHSIEVLLVTHKKDKYLVFKIMHSVLDGKASLVFVQNIMNCLKGEELIPSIDDMTDIEFVKQHENYSKKESKIPKIIIKDTQRIDKYKVRWKVVEIPGYPTAVIGRLSRILSDLSPDKCGRVMIPADVRRYEKDTNYNTNLTLPIFLTVKENDTFEDINGNLLNQMRDKKELNRANTRYFYYDKYPKAVRHAVLKVLLSYARKKNMFSVSGLVSLLGKVDLKEYDNPYIEFEEFYSLPINQALIPIAMVIVQYNDKTVINLAYYEGQFSESKMEEIADTIKNALSPNLYAFNNTKKVYDENVFDSLRSNLESPKEKTAVVDDKEYSYEELLNRAKKISELLKMNSINEDICICEERSFNYIASVLACVLNNITFVPIDRYTKSAKDINTILSMTSSGKILVDKEIDGIDKNAFIFVKDAEELNGIPFMFESDEEKEVYRIFTSGTTDVPKCVPIRQKNLNNYLLWAIDNYEKEEAINMPLFTSLSVDLTITSTFLPLVSGGFIHTYPDNFQASIFNKIISDEKLNVIKCTPTHFAFLDENLVKPGKAKTFILGGENLSTELRDRIKGVFGKDTIIYNEYGPTETTVGVTCFKADENNEELNVAVGTPIYNTKILLKKNESQEIINKENDIGEILIGGDSVFKGYRAGESDCFDTINGELYYRSGDLGFIRDGKLYCVGRVDNQVKINGNRVELEYIKNTIDKADGVEDSVVIYEDGLYAFVISNNKDEAGIKDFLSENVPSYMIPKRIVFIDDIPVNKSGKADIAFLKKQLETDSKEEKDTTGEESLLLKILSEFYDEAPVSKEDNLYAIGMESLDVLLFTERVKNEYITSEKEDDFYKEVLSKVNHLTIADLEKMIVKFGGKI